MSDESSSQSRVCQANYTVEDIELYYYFWVTANGESWYQTLKLENSPTPYRSWQQKIFSPFVMILLSSSLLLGILGLISWHNETKIPNSYQKLSQTTIIN